MRAETASNRASTEPATAAPARTVAGRKAAQIAARPEPIAMAGAATKRRQEHGPAEHPRQRRVGRAAGGEGRDHHGHDGVAAKNRATAVGTVKSRSPSEIRSASGP